MPRSYMREEDWSTSDNDVQKALAAEEAFRDKNPIVGRDKWIVDRLIGSWGRVILLPKYKTDWRVL